MTDAKEKQAVISSQDTSLGQDASNDASDLMGSRSEKGGGNSARKKRGGEGFTRIIRNGIKYAARLPLEGSRKKKTKRRY